MICTIRRRLMLLMYPQSHIHVVAAEWLKFAVQSGAVWNHRRRRQVGAPQQHPAAGFSGPRQSTIHPLEPAWHKRASNHDSDQKALWQGRPCTNGI